MVEPSLELRYECLKDPTKLKLCLFLQNVDDNLLSISKDDYSQLQTKVLLLDQTTCQLEEVEKLNEGLSAVILELRQGKGASGHEVEIEVLKRRLSSYKTLMQRLKSSLSTGQATSLLDPDLGEYLTKECTRHTLAFQIWIKMKS